MSGKNFLRIPDAVSFSLRDAAVIRDDYEGAFKRTEPGQTHPSGMGTVAEQPRQHPINGQQGPQKKGLQVKIAATHAGIITRNNGFYLPDKMKRGSTTFTDNFPKPVLLHHEDHADPVGRIVLANYVDTSGAITDKYNGTIVKDRFGKETGTITDKLLRDFIDGRMPFAAQVDIVRTLLKDSILEDADYGGLGHIQVVANITDPVAIQKLLDGRYLTGSVGATTDKAVCSVCRSDWTESGPCEHKPGGIYDGAKCFIIAGALSYDEYSFVNVPADRHSKVLQLNYNGIQDDVEVLDDFAGRIYEAVLSFPQYDSVQDKEEGSMTVKDAKTPDTEVEQSITDSVPAPAEGTEAAPEATEVVEDSAEAPAEGVEAQDEAQNVEDVASEGVDEFTALFDSLAEGLSDEDEEKLYDMLWQEAEAAFAEGEFTLEELGTETLEDAKLSSEKRKKLAGSTFCGPGRSFPVNDCAHVTAARRLIGRYKGEGSKDSILKCVDRKAKAMGCTSKKKKEKDEVKPEEGQVQDEAGKLEPVLTELLQIVGGAAEVAALSDNEKTLLQQLVEKLALLSGETVSDAVIAKDLAVAKDCHQLVLDEVVALEEKVGELRDHLDATRTEYHALYGDMEALQDELVKQKESNRKDKESHLTTLSSLKDNSVEERDFTKLTDEQLTSELVRLTDEVDMGQIVDKLGDGMARIPTEDVESPVDIQDENNQKSEVTLQELRELEDEYATLLFKNATLAENFRLNTLKRWELEGKKLPDTEEK